MDAVTLVLFIIGFVLLIGGAEILVRGAAQLAGAFGITPLVIGLTVVAFGTSSPELAVTTYSAFTGKPDIALGNVVGSNIANILLILGIAAALVPVRVARQLLRFDVPLMIAVSLLMYLMALDGIIGRLDGLLLFVGIVLYIAYAIYQSRRDNQAGEADLDVDITAPATPLGVALSFGRIAVGLALLVVGSNWLVNGASELARFFGLSELVIGLTIVAVGTSLPEVATTVVATLRGEGDIAVGNAIGSNIFNVLSVMGLTALVAPVGIPIPAAALTFDIPVMLAISVACVPVLYTRYRIERWEGWLFLGFYLAYTTYLVLAALNSPALATYGRIMALVVIPITTLALIGLTLRDWRSNQRKISTSEATD